MLLEVKLSGYCYFFYFDTLHIRDDLDVKNAVFLLKSLYLLRLESFNQLTNGGDGSFDVLLAQLILTVPTRINDAHQSA